MAMALRRVRSSLPFLFARSSRCSPKLASSDWSSDVQQHLLRRAVFAWSARNVSSASAPPHQVLSMPALSPTMSQGNVGKWKKKEGDELKAGDVLCEIETDKATLDFESLEEGFLAKILVPAGSKDVPVGKPLCIVVENAQDVSQFRDGSVVNASPQAPPLQPPQADKGKSLPSTSSSVERAGSPVERVGSPVERVGPSVRRLLAESGLSQSKLRGTGPRGILVKGDILAAMKGGVNVGAPKLVGSARAPPTSRPPAPAAEVAFDNVATSQIRKIIAKRLLESKTSIPHLYLSADAVLDPTLAIRKQLLDEHKVKLSVNDFVIRAAALALKAIPEANAFWDENAREAVVNNSIDIAIAVATDKGLFTPVVRHADQKSLSLISSEVKALAEKARNGKLAPHEFQGGTFSISNLGMYPVDQFCAIINPPQACILAVGKGERTVVWNEIAPGFGQPTCITRISVTISADNRVLDADVAGRFMQSLLANLSNPQSMLL